MVKTYNTAPVLTALQTARQVLILLPKNPKVDSVAAALSLYLVLTKAKLSTTIGCPTEMTVGFNRLFGVDKIKQRIGNQNLVISFDYPEDSLEKVAYDKDPQNQKFHLTIEPKAGFEPLDVNKVQYSYTGSSADVIFVIGASGVEDLGTLYQQEKKLLDDKQKTLVNLSTLEKNSQFGTVNLYDPTASGESEIMLSVFQALNLPLDADMATNLLAGIESSTGNLSTAASADTYEAVATLLRQGAKKGHLVTAPSRVQSPFGQTAAPVNGQVSPFGVPTAPFAGFRQQPTAAPMVDELTEPVVGPTNVAPSPDWLKPKVFKSTGTNV